nr:NADH dehydrogenase subunit 4 [Wallacea dactyliferae]
MMKMLMFMFFMIPLWFLNFWMVQFMVFLLMLMSVISIVPSTSFSLISYVYGMDNLSYFLVILSIWIIGLMMIASSKIYINKDYYENFVFVLMILLISLVMFFISMNLLLFYVYFEISLIPIMLLILGWGYQPERLLAGMYMIFYTLIFSLPMLLGVFFLYNKNKSLMFFEFSIVDSIYMYLLLTMVFLVKMPMYMIHLWLPKAHVEAPVSGSMVLAGVMLKLGGYGMMRLMKIFIGVSSSINIFFIMISLLGGVTVSLICLRQTDIKSLIAYSSVSHMSIVLGGIMTLSMIGFSGSLMMMISHGLCSSGLFCMANIYYERLFSRSMYLVKGFINIIPSMSLSMFLLSVSNMAAPPSLNLLSEIYLFMSLVSWNFNLMFLLMLLSFFSAVYSIYLYSFSNHGKFMSGLYSLFSGFNREYLLIYLHWIPLNLMVLVGEFFLI